MDQGRNAKRYATTQSLLVKCDTWGEFVALYATDVSQGGMFVVTEEAPPVLSEIDVQLKLPEGHEIPLRARVVHVIEPAQAAHGQRDPGVGIEFIGMDAATRTQIHQLVEFARWQGTSLAPTATLASHMFEMNAGATPAQVMQSLPSPPMAQATPREAIPSARVIDGETASSGVRRASGVPRGRAEGAVSSKPSGPPRKRRTDSGPAGSSSSSPGKRASAEPAAPPAPPPPKPTDQIQLKVGISHLAAKRFVEANKHFQSMLEANPGDLEVTKWLYTTIARKAVANGDETGARAAYEKVLAVSEDSQEARKFVRELDQRKKLEAIPFGRFFAKKKP
jgi:uncharacterized protein (TIGR02266 family)